MVKSNKIFSFFSVLFASTLIAVWMESDGFLKDVYNNIYSSLTVSVYLSEDATEYEIKSITKDLKSNAEIIINNFSDSKSAYDKLREDPVVSKQLELVEDNFVLPASFELQIKHFDMNKVYRVIERIKKNKLVQYVDLNPELVQKGNNLLAKIKKAAILNGIVLPLCSLFFFFLGGYLYMLRSYDKLVVSWKVTSSTKKELVLCVKKQFFTGIIAGLIGAVICYLLVTFTGVKFYIGFLKFIFIVLISGIMAALSYFVNAYKSCVKIT